MARGTHKSPQCKRSGKKQKSKNKSLVLIQANNEVIFKFKYAM